MADVNQKCTDIVHVCKKDNHKCNIVWCVSTSLTNMWLTCKYQYMANFGPSMLWGYKDYNFQVNKFVSTCRRFCNRCFRTCIHILWDSRRLFPLFPPSCAVIYKSIYTLKVWIGWKVGQVKMTILSIPWQCDWRGMILKTGLCLPRVLNSEAIY